MKQGWILYLVLFGILIIVVIQVGVHLYYENYDNLIHHSDFDVFIEEQYYYRGGIYLNEEYSIPDYYSEKYGTFLHEIVESNSRLIKMLDNDTLYIKLDNNLTKKVVLPFKVTVN